MQTVLYDYQKKIADDIFNRMCTKEIRGAYLALEVGTGKTVTSLSVADQLQKTGSIQSVVVICPVSKVNDWENDIKKEIPEFAYSFVTSFQSSWRTKNATRIESQMKSHSTILIIDEGHKMKTYDSKQSKFIQMLSEKYNPYVLILSATSQNKKYIDLYPQYKTLGSSLFDIKPKDFKQQYCVEAANYNLVYAGKARFPFNEIVSYKQVETMDKEILNYTYYKKYDSEYNRPIEITQSFKITSDMKYFRDKKVWPKMDEEAIKQALVTGGVENIDTDFIIANRPTLHHIYMRESCSGFICDKILKDNPKLQWLEDFIDGVEGRLVIFTNFINETVLISELCKKLKRPHCIYDGGHKDLTDWHLFENCIAIVNVVAGGAGLNDFVKTNIAVFFSPPENYIDFTQAKGRIDRIGQTKQPVYYYLQIVGGIEPVIYKALAEGKDFDQHLFDAWEGSKSE